MDVAAASRSSSVPISSGSGRPLGVGIVACGVGIGACGVGIVDMCTPLVSTVFCLVYLLGVFSRMRERDWSGHSAAEFVDEGAFLIANVIVMLLISSSSRIIHRHPVRVVARF